MRPRTLPAILLFLSSYAPLGLILAAQDFNWPEKKFGNPYTVGIIGILMLTAWALPFSILSRIKGGKICTVKSVSNKTSELVNYALPYLVTFVGLRLDDPTSLVSFILFMVLFGALTIRTQTLWINPLLVLGGYRLYEVELENTADGEPVMLIAPRRIHANERCRIVALTDFQSYATETDIDGIAKKQNASDDESLCPDIEE